jgi:hypothetical protein
MCLDLVSFPVLSQIKPQAPIYSPVFQLSLDYTLDFKSLLAIIAFDFLDNSKDFKIYTYVISEPSP